MKLPGYQHVLRIAALTLLVVMSVPLEAIAQGRSRRVLSGLDKKCAKFVNCHDASDGRWDGRGPRPRVVFGYPPVVRGRVWGPVVIANIRIGRYGCGDYDRYGPWRGRGRGR